MKTIVMLFVLMAGIEVSYAASDFTGRWEVAVREFGHKNYYLPMVDGRLTISQQGERYSANYGTTQFTGNMQAGNLHLVCVNGCGDLSIQASSGGLSGTGTLTGIPVTITARRPIKRPAKAQSYNYDPKVFQSFYSPAATPVLHLFPGDSVQTRTLDSRGQDYDGKPKAPRGNPLIGPFYVEGAMPGDTLVVHVDRLRTNRNFAYQTDSIASTALESSYLLSLPRRKIDYATWMIDAASGTASLKNPSSHLQGYTIKLKPMLGCIGVAPPHDESLGSGHLGVFGGNMDFPELGEGITLYLPVNEPGALLYLGDGHAEQGDGELPGQGLETSLDVHFTVSLIEDKSLGQVWMENGDYVMVSGVGGTVDEAMKRATTGMSLWLSNHYHLSPQDIAAVLGTMMHYQIAEVVDSEYHVVAKLRRDVLAKLGK